MASWEHGNHVLPTGGVSEEPHQLLVALKKLKGCEPALQLKG